MPKTVFDTLRQFGGGGAAPGPAEIIRRLYGTGPRGGLNTTAAAADLGVSARTVRRWALQGIPASPAGGQIRQNYQTWETTPTGRDTILRAVNTAKRDQITAVTFLGKVIISNDNRNNTIRTLNFTLSPAETNLLLDTARVGSEADLHAALEYLAGEHGLGGASLDIADLNIR